MARPKGSKNKSTPTLSETTLRVVQAEVQRLVGRDFDALHDILKRIETQNKVIIAQHNVAAKENEKHHTAVAKTLVALGAILEEPQHHTEVLSTIREFLAHIK